MLILTKNVLVVFAMLNRVVNHLVVTWMPVHFHVVNYQIKENYWIDCVKPGGSLEACGKNKACSDECVHAYMRRYVIYCTGGRTPTCEDYARIHNGGPNGCKEAATLPYWIRVLACYG